MENEIQPPAGRDRDRRSTWVWGSSLRERRLRRGGGTSGTIIRGTTDQPVSLDPAGAYDLPSYDIIYNIYQNLLQFPPGEDKPVPEAAESCDFTDDTTYECTIKDGSEVLRRLGPDGRGRRLLVRAQRRYRRSERRLVAAREHEEHRAPRTTTRLSSTSPRPTPRGRRCSRPVRSRSSRRTATPDKELETETFIGSGRYEVAEYQPGQQTVLQANPEYTGDAPPKTDQAIIQYFDKASALKLALEQGDVDIAYRSLSPTDIADLESAEGVEVVSGEGAEIRYMVFNLDQMPGETDEEKLAIRQAIAQTIDRQSIADNVYNGTVKPLYSMIPTGLEFNGPSFDEAYGESPDTAAAEQTLKDAGVDTPVPLEVWYTPSHYGASSGDEYAEIKRQLDESGLFEVSLESTEWNQYSEAAFTDKYPIYQLGWFPDYPDADDYVGNFYSETSFLNIHYDNPEMTEAPRRGEGVDRRRRPRGGVRPDPADRRRGRADDPDLGGRSGRRRRSRESRVSRTRSIPSFIFRFWLLSKEG